MSSNEHKLGYTSINKTRCPVESQKTTSFVFVAWFHPIGLIKI